MLDSIFEFTSQLPNPRWRYPSFHLSLSCLCCCSLHRYGLYCIGYSFQLDRWMGFKLHTSQPEYRSLRALPAIPTCLSLFLLCFGNGYSPWHFARGPTNVYAVPSPFAILCTRLTYRSILNFVNCLVCNWPSLPIYNKLSYLFVDEWQDQWCPIRDLFHPSIDCHYLVILEQHNWRRMASGNDSIIRVR